MTNKKSSFISLRIEGEYLEQLKAESLKSDRTLSYIARSKIIKQLESEKVK